MNERKATKRALLTSITALVMCVVMLAGTTFAWFTDTAKTNVNRIEAGKLDVQLMMKDNSGRWVNAEGETLKWVKAQGGENQAILWEPGAEYKLPELKIVNNGNLKLKYKIVITGASGDVDLLNVIDFSAEITGVNNAVFSNVNVRDNNPVVYDKALEPNKEDVIALSGKMQTSANNTYMSKTISGISITVYAAQATGEYDSISDQYDKAAAYPTVAPVLNLNTGESVTLENNALPETTIDEGGAVSTIPANTTMKNGNDDISGENGTLERVIKTTIATNPATGVDTATYDISYNFTQNGTTTKVTEFSEIVTNVLQLASGLEGVAVTHTHDNTRREMTPAATEDANTDGQFYYNKTTGKLTIWSKQYSAFAVSYKANFAAVVNGQFFNTLPDAVAAAKDGDTITLVRDVAADVVIPEGKTITLDLGGHKLTNVQEHTIVNNGTLTITGTGTVDNVTNARAALVNYGSATLNGGNFTRSKENAENNKDDGGGNSYYTILNDKGATMTINEGVTVSNVGHFSSMIRNGGDENTAAVSTMTINGGTFSGGFNTVKNDENGVLTINGGDFSNTDQYVIMNWNKATISDGTFEANASAEAVLFTAKYMESRAVGELKIKGGTYVCAKNQKLIIDRFNHNDQYLGTAVISGGAFTDLASAVKYATNGATITLAGDVSAERINLEDKSITVDLNGHTLTSTAAYGVMFCAKNGKTITVNGTTPGSKLVGTVMVTEKTDGHIVLNGGTYESDKYVPVYINGAVNTENSTLKIKDAVITAIGTKSDQDSGWGVYLAGYATSTIKNTKITAPVTGIEIRAGKLDLTNCTVTGGNGEVKEKADGSGTTVTNAAVAVSQHTTKKSIDVTIKGGEYTATAALYQTNVQGTGSQGVKATVLSGMFTGEVKAATEGAITIKGGTFSSQPDSKYIAKGYTATNDNGVWTVAKS